MDEAACDGWVNAEGANDGGRGLLLRALQPVGTRCARQLVGPALLP